MTLSKEIVIDLIQVVENGTVQIRTATKIMEDGKELNRTYHRDVINPGQDYSQEDERVKAICSAVHTPKVIAAYQSILEASLSKLKG